jgi:hypothetical protein
MPEAPSTKLPEPKIKTDPEFEAMFKQAETAYPDMPKFLLRVALMTALREEDAHQKKHLPKRKHIIDLANAVEDEYVREPPPNLEYYGMEIIPPKDKETTDVEIIEPISQNPETSGEVLDHPGQRTDLKGERGLDDDHTGASLDPAV